MGQTESSFSDALFRKGEFEDIIERIQTLIGESENSNPADSQQTASAKRQLATTLTTEEWNIVSLLCRSKAAVTSGVQLAQLRSRLMALWMGGEAPRQCAASSLVMALVCFLEAAFGSCDLTTVMSRVENMSAPMPRDEDDVDDSATSDPSKVEPPHVRKPLKWAAYLASLPPNNAWHEMHQEVDRLEQQQQQQGSSSCPLRTWCTMIAMAAYCAAVINAINFKRKLPSGNGGAPAAVSGEGEGQLRRDARTMGLYLLAKAVRCVAASASNVVAEELWDMFRADELLASMATVSSSYHAAPVVRTWEDVPKKYVGQTHMVKEIGELLRAKREGLLPSEKPTVLFLFGLSGHGKTEIAKWLARIMHFESWKKQQQQQEQQGGGGSGGNNDTENAADFDPESTKDMLLLNMGNYNTEASLYSLIDPPTGIVGEGGLIPAIERQRRLVIVADEFEKSSTHAVNNLWLPAFENNGKLASGKDPTRKVPTKDVTFVLTSNLCDAEIAASAERYHSSNEQGKRAMREQWAQLCAKKLSEFVGNNALAPRITRFIPVVPFTPAELRRYVELQVHSFQRHQLSRGVEMYYTAGVVDYLAQSVRNFHTLSVERTLLAPMMAASDAKSKSVVVGTKLKLHPIRDFAAGAAGSPAADSSGSAGNLLEWFLSADAVEELSKSSPSATAAAHSDGAKRVAGWMRSRRLTQEKDAVEAEARLQRQQQIQKEKEEVAAAAAAAQREREEEEARRAAAAASAERQRQLEQEQRERAEAADRIAEAAAAAAAREAEKCEEEMAAEILRRQQKETEAADEEDKRRKEAAGTDKLFESPVRRQQQREEQQQREQKEREAAAEERRLAEAGEAKRRKEAAATALEEKRRLDELSRQRQEELVRARITTPTTASSSSPCSPPQPQQLQMQMQMEVDYQRQEDHNKQKKTATSSSSPTQGSQQQQQQMMMMEKLQAQSKLETEYKLEQQAAVHAAVRQDLEMQLQRQQIEHDAKLKLLNHNALALETENKSLKLEVSHLQDLVKDLQKALAVALLFGISVALIASLFIPFKIVLLTAAAVFSLGYYFITNFVDLVIAAAKGLWNLIGPRNCIAILVAIVAYALVVGGAYGAFSSPPPCKQIVDAATAAAATNGAQ